MKIVALDELAKTCGYFYNAEWDNGCKCPNNGYNCKHPDCGEKEDGVGLCMSFTCPVAYEADEEDCEKVGIEYQEGEYMIVPNEAG